MKTFFNNILFSVLLLFLFSCDDQVKNIEISTDAPISVNQGDIFDIYFKIKNTSEKHQELLSIDIEQEYLEGIAILETSPMFNDSFHIPLFNMQSYSFNKTINPNSEITIVFHVKALTKGYYKGNIDFPINSEMSFITRPIFTEITDKDESSVATSSTDNLNTITSKPIKSNPPPPKKLSPEKLRSAWYQYSSKKLKNELTRILAQKNEKGEFIYEYYPSYRWSEQSGYTTTEGILFYKHNGHGSAEMHNSVGGSVTESASWNIQWAPATKSSPFDSDIVFTLDYEYGKWSNHIGSDNMLWTSVESFCKEHLSNKDTERFMFFGDSLRNAFMKENNCTLGADGRFK